jgi:phage protein D
VGTKFVGYVMVVQPSAITRAGYVNESPFQTSELVCLGASSDMRGKKTRIWESPNLRQIVGMLADEYRFSYSIPVDEFRLPRLVQRGESEWQHLHKICKNLGYFVTSHGTDIHIYDPDMVLGRGLPYVELTTMEGATENVAYAPGRIMEFHGDFSAATEGSKTIYNFLDVQGNPFAISTDQLFEVGSFGVPSPSRLIDDEVVTAYSYEEGERALRSDIKASFDFNAEVSTTGVTQVVPGSVVNINKYNSYFDGLWMVRSVRHSLARTIYVSNLKISRDTLNDPQSPITVPLIEKYSTPPAPLLIDGRWKSSVSRRNEYA